MSFPKYPAYKHSGVAWLGDVPSHWRIDRFKWSARDCKNGTWGDDPKGDGDDIVCVRVADFDRVRLRVRLEDPTTRNVTASDRASRLLSPGDLLIEKSGGGELQPVGCTVLFDDVRPAICSNFIARVRLTSGAIASYWRYLHAAAYAARLNERSIKQTSGIQNLDQQRYFDELAVFPPEAEQRAIATFLERETARIDALVAEQDRLIELLKEKREAAICHVLTKGLNPELPSKDSGIEWLGRVPAHWKIVRCGLFVSILSGFAFPSAGFSMDVANPKLLRGVNIGVGRLRWDEVVYWTRVEGDDLERFALKAGDLVVGMDRPLIAEGMRVAEVQSEDLPCMLLQRVAALRPRRELRRRYLKYLLASPFFVAHFSPETTGVSVPHISPEQIKSFVIPLPPISEQDALIAQIEDVTGRFDALVVETKRAIDLLHERRTALISAVATGQIDVRTESTRTTA